MPALFDLLREELDAAVRVVLGHFISSTSIPTWTARPHRAVSDELMLASGGYPWTVIPVQDRKTYMEALEEASVAENIVPFADFLGASSNEDSPANRCQPFRSALITRPRLGHPREPSRYL